MSSRKMGTVIGGLVGGATPLLAALLATSGCGTVESAREMTPPAVEVTPVMPRETRLYREWAGTLDGYFIAEIRPHVEGRLIRRLYREGAFVKKGVALFEIGPPEAEAALDRTGGAAWTMVPSPIDGIAGVARARAGDLVGAHTVLTTVATVDWIKVHFHASRLEYLGWTRRRDPDDRRPSTHPGHRALFELFLADGAPYAHRGHLLPGGREADATSGTVALTAVFPNPDHLLRPGQHGRLLAEVDVNDGTLPVPQRAVVEHGGLSRVAVVGRRPARAEP